MLPESREFKRQHPEKVAGVRVQEAAIGQADAGARKAISQLDA